MTIRFLKSWNGYFEGQIVSNPNGRTEADLITLGYAVADLDGPDNTPLPVTATTNPVTGWISLSAGGRNALADSGIYSRPAVAGCGDSLIAGAVAGGSPYNKATTRGGIKFRNTGNFSVGGTRTDQMLTQVALASAAGARVVVIDGGINDIVQGVSESTLQVNWIANITAILAAGMRPIDVGLPPTNTAGNVPRYCQHEIWRKLYCYKYDIQHADVYTPLATAAGAYRSGYNTDAVHYNSVGAYYAEPIITAHITTPITSSAPLLAMTDTAADSAAFPGNAVSFSGTIGSNGWFGPTGAGGAMSVTAADTGDLGAWMRCTCTAAVSAGFTPAAVSIASLGWAIGDKIAIGFRIRWGDTSGALAVSAYFTGIGITGDQPLFQDLGGPTGDAMTVYKEVAIASGVNIGVSFFASGTGWFEVNRPIIVNLTKLGLA